MPTATTKGTLDRALELMREGRVQEADKLIADERARITDEEKAERAAMPKAEPKDERELILLIFEEVAIRLGRPPRLSMLVDQLLAPPQPQE